MAGFGLPDAPAPPAELLGHEACGDRQLAVGQKRIEGLLGAAVEAGAWPVTGGQQDDVGEASRARAKVGLCLEHELLVALSQPAYLAARGLSPLASPRKAARQTWEQR